MPYNCPSSISEEPSSAGSLARRTSSSSFVDSTGAGTDVGELAAAWVSWPSGWVAMFALERTVRGDVDWAFEESAMISVKDTCGLQTESPRGSSSMRLASIEEQRGGCRKLRKVVSESTERRGVAD